MSFDSLPRFHEDKFYYPIPLVVDHFQNTYSSDRTVARHTLHQRDCPIALLKKQTNHLIPMLKQQIQTTIWLILLRQRIILPQQITQSASQIPLTVKTKLVLMKMGNGVFSHPSSVIFRVKT